MSQAEYLHLLGERKALQQMLAGVPPPLLPGGDNAPSWPVRERSRDEPGPAG